MYKVDAKMFLRGGLPFSVSCAKIYVFQLLAVGFFSKLINNDVCCGNNYPKNNLKGLYPFLFAYKDHIQSIEIVLYMDRKSSTCIYKTVLKSF